VSGELLRLRQPLAPIKDKVEATVTVLSTHGPAAIVASTAGIALFEQGHHNGEPPAAARGFVLRPMMVTTQPW